MDVQAVSTAIAATLEGLGLHIYDYGPDQPASPSAFIFPQTFPYHDTLSDGTNAIFVVRLLVSSVAMQAGQQLLNALISTTGTKSVPAAIEANGGLLGGAVSSATAREMRNYGIVQLHDKATRYLSAEIVVSVTV